MASGLLKTEWWNAGAVICLEHGADLHMAQLTPLPLTVSCFSKIQIGFTFLIPAYPGGPGKRAVKPVICELVILARVISRAAVGTEFLSPYPYPWRSPYLRQTWLFL